METIITVYSILLAVPVLTAITYLILSRKQSRTPEQTDRFRRSKETVRVNFGVALAAYGITVILSSALIYTKTSADVLWTFLAIGTVTSALCVRDWLSSKFSYTTVDEDGVTLVRAFGKAKHILYSDISHFKEMPWKGKRPRRDRDNILYHCFGNNGKRLCMIFMEYSTSTAFTAKLSEHNVKLTD